MAKTSVKTYDLSLGNDTLEIQPVGKPLDGVTLVSYHLQGDGVVNGTVTVKLQESNIHLSGQKDIASASAVANANTTEYVGRFDVGGTFLSFNVVLGTATLGVITLTLNYQ